MSCAISSRGWWCLSPGPVDTAFPPSRETRTTAPVAGEPLCPPSVRARPDDFQDDGGDAKPAACAKPPSTTTPIELADLGQPARRCGCGLARSARHSDGLDLDLDFRQVERFDLDDRVGRVRRPEPLATQLDDLRKGTHIRQKDGHLDDAFQTRAARLQHPTQVAKRQVGLRIEVAYTDELTGLIDPGLTRDEQEIANPETL